MVGASMTPLRRRVRWLLAPLALYAGLLFDWRPARDPRPLVLRRFTGTGPLRAGAARVALDPPLPIVRAGYGPTRALATSVHDPLEVRAVVLECAGRSLAIVLADLVLIPDRLARALEARVADLGLGGVLLAATHTHSSFGGFDERLLAQAAGTGRYRREVAEGLLER